MRFQYLLCLSFLAAAVTPALSLPVPPHYTVKLPGQIRSVQLTAGQATQMNINPNTTAKDSKPPPIRYKVNLPMRWNTRPGGSPLGQEKTLVQAENRKDLVHTPEGLKPQNLRAHTTQQAALARKNHRLQHGRDRFQAAAEAHKNTLGLPGKGAVYNAFGERYSGKNVRIANFNSHLPGNKV